MTTKTNKTLGTAPLALALLALASVGCKPKTAGSDLQSITGVNAAGQEAALSLVPVRNFTVAKLADGSSDAGALQAEAIVKARLFALVECVQAKSKNGQTLTASELMSAVEMRAAIDDLYVDGTRRLLTSAKDDALADFGDASKKLVVVPCHVHGRRLLSWTAASDIQIRALGMPKNLAAAGQDRDRALETYRAMQALHQSLRGTYMKDAKQDFMPRLPAMIDMMREQAGFDADVSKLASRIRRADALYNTCSTVSTAKTSLPYAEQLRSVNYSCAPHGKIAGGFVYRAGGASGKDYEKVKDELALEIESAHAAVYPRSQEHDQALFDLWNLLTTGKPWSELGKDSADLAEYLTSGKGFAFAEKFASGAPGAKAAGDDAPELTTVSHVAAPLVAFVAKTNASRAVRILRAPSSKTAGRGVLEGGHLTTAEKRPSTSLKRVSDVAKAMGPAGREGLPNLGNSVAHALDVIRQAP